LTTFLLALCLLPAPAVRADDARPRQKLYVTNSAGDDVTVVDLATRKAVRSIKVGANPHGLVAPAAQDFVLVTTEVKNGELIWIDPRKDEVVRRMPTGPTPNALAVTPDGKFAYVPVGDGHWEVFDLAAAKIVERIFTGGRPHNTVCSADGQWMFLAPMGSPKAVTVVEVATRKPVGKIPFSDQVRPIALAPDAKRLYAEVDGLIGFEVADVATRKRLHRVAAEVSPAAPKKSSRSHGLAVRPDGKEVWECDVEHHEVHVYDVTGERPRQVATVPMGGSVYWLTFDPEGKYCYVSVLSRNEVAVVDTATRQVVARIAVGRAPKRLLVVNVPAGKS
jgi:YVTN family beta-propeller protein